MEAHEALHKLYGSNYRVTEEVEIIQENLSKLRENRSRKISYIRNLKQHPEIYQPFFIIVTLRFRPFDFLMAIGPYDLTPYLMTGVSSLGVPGVPAHPDFGRSVNPISPRGDKLCLPNYYWHTRIFRPSDGPV